MTETLAQIERMPWVFPGVMFFLLVFLMSVRFRKAGVEIRRAFALVCFCIIIAGNIFWFEELDNSGGRATAPAWRLLKIKGALFEDLWREQPARLGNLGDRMDIYMAVRKHCRKRGIVLCSGSLEDVGLSERYLIQLSAVNYVRRGGNDSAAPCSGRPVGFQIQSVETNDGVRYSFYDTLDAKRGDVQIWVGCDRAAFYIPVAVKTKVINPETER